MTTKIASENDLQTEVMDHHGIVAAMCKELNIEELINKKIGSKDPRRVIQPGKAVVAMIINGLGFTNRRLYLTPQFFQNKSVQKWLGEDVRAEQLDDHTLGKALDEIAEYGPTKLFGETAFAIASENGLLGKTAHLDTTSFSLSGEYKTDEPTAIEVKHGYSKDNNPDMKQVMLSLLVSGPASIPLWCEPQSGNSSDKKTFHETIESVKAFQKQIKLSNFVWVADSALYSIEQLLSYNTTLIWLTRVPENIKEARTLLEREDASFSWTNLENGYRYVETFSSYGGLKQRWLLVFSEQAYRREKKTFDKKINTQLKAATKAAWHLGNEVFNCEEDAMIALAKITESFKFFSFEAKIYPVEKYEKAGRPKPGEKKALVGYSINVEIVHNELLINQYLRRKGRFILATNQLDINELSCHEMLLEYKDQQDVERGFRFLKDPWFMVDSFFVKSRQRIASLMMIMTLCLLIYNYAQYKLRKALHDTKETLPNQLGKEVQNPTLRWIFQIMEGVALVKIKLPTKSDFQIFISNLNNVRIKIIKLFGSTACEIYGIPPDFAGM